MRTVWLVAPCTSINTHPPDPQSAPTQHSALTPCPCPTWQGSGTACTAVEQEWEIPAPSGKDTGLRAGASALCRCGTQQTLHPLQHQV